MKTIPWLLLSACACSAQMGRMYFDTKASPIHSVCVLPADAQLFRLGMKGGEALPKESEDWSAKLTATVRRAISQAGAKLTPDYSSDDWKNDEPARSALVQVRGKYSNIAVQMRKKPDGVKKARYTIGDEIALLPCAAQAESIAFINAAGSIQTGKRKIFSVLVGGVGGIFMSLSRYDLWIAFADSRTGRIAALVRVNSVGGAKTANDPDEALNKALISYLKKVRIGSATAD